MFGLSTTTAWILAVSFLIAAAGFLLSVWPLTLVGIALCALSGRWAFAVAMGLLLDIGYGAPVGPLHALYLPFTLWALLCAALRLFGARYMLGRGDSGTL